MEFLEAAIKKNLEENEDQRRQILGVGGLGTQNSILCMNRLNFNSKKELRMLFAKAAGAQAEETK